MKKIWVLTASTREGIIETWTFKANNPMEIMAYITDNRGRFVWLLDKLRLVNYYTKEWETITAAELLIEIKKRRIATDSDCGFLLYEIDPAQVREVAELTQPIKEESEILFSEKQTL